MKLNQMRQVPVTKKNIVNTCNVCFILCKGDFNYHQEIRLYVTLWSIIATNTIISTCVCDVVAAAPKAIPSAEMNDSKTLQLMILYDPFII